MTNVSSGAPGSQGSARKAPVHLSITTLGWSLSLFFVVTYLLCIASGLAFPDWAMHLPWLQFFPGFKWLTPTGFLIGLAEAFAYGWYVAVLFVPLYNSIADWRARN